MGGFTGGFGKWDDTGSWASKQKMNREVKEKGKRKTQKGGGGHKDKKVSLFI